MSRLPRLAIRRLRTELASAALGLLATGCPQLLSDGFNVGELTSPTGNGGDPNGDRNAAGTSPVISMPCSGVPCGEAGGASATAGGSGGTVPNPTNGGGTSTGSSGSASAGTAPGSGSGGTLSNGGAGGSDPGGAGGSGGTLTTPVVDAGPDPSDECPEHAEQAEAGTCGCGVPPEMDCSNLEEFLLHRYAFDGSTAVIADVVGNAHGEGIDVTPTGEGTLDLDGDEQHVLLPEGILAGLQNASFEVWFEWRGGDIWQRVFDFGNRNSPSEITATQTYFYLTPEGYDTAGEDQVERGLAISYSTAGPDQEMRIGTGIVLEVDTLVHVVVSLDDTNDEVSIYVDGELATSVVFEGTLAEIEDTNNYFGRSLYSGDPYFDGVLHEFRMHGTALDATDVATSYTLGPNPTFLTD